MKKRLIFIALLICSTGVSNGYDVQHVNSKLENILKENPGKLELINPSLPRVADKYTGEKKEIILHIHNFLNYKFQNSVFYSQDVSPQLQVKINILNARSFTGQEFIVHLEKLKKDYDYWTIEYEFIKYNIFITQVGLLLNHQDFEGAKSLVTSYFTHSDESINFTVRNSSYINFNTFTQLFRWLKIDSDSLLEKRWEYFPKERNAAYNVVRQKGYINTDCSTLDILNINNDLIDQLFCKLFNKEFEASDLDTIATLNNNVQNISDRINYYSYIQKHPSYYQEMLNKQELLAKEILKHDVHFINGYLTLLKIYDTQNKCDAFDEYQTLLKENYIGDQARRENAFERQYINCGK